MSDTPGRPAADATPTGAPQRVVDAARKHATDVAEAAARDEMHYMGTAAGSGDVIAAAAFGVRRSDHLAYCLTEAVAAAAESLSAEKLRWRKDDNGEAIRAAAARLEPIWDDDACYLPLRPEQLRRRLREGVNEILAAAWACAADGTLTANGDSPDDAPRWRAAETLAAAESPANWRDAYRGMLSEEIDRSAYWELNAERSILAQPQRKQSALRGAAAAVAQQPPTAEQPDAATLSIGL